VKSRTGIFRVFTIILLGVAIWTAYANVFSDDAAVRAQADDLVRKTAGCGAKCKVAGIRGSRGMLQESIEYDNDAVGGYLVTCRRAYIIAGDHACEAQKR
jgi:hypothetical protein